MSDETMAVIQSINHIAISPAVRSGRAHIVGTMITVADVAMAKVFHEQDDVRARLFQEKYPGLADKQPLVKHKGNPIEKESINECGDRHSEP